MLSLKNPFAKSAPAPEPAESSMPAGDRNLKRWELEAGRTRKRVEELTSQLDTARLPLADAKQLLGERMSEELDTGTAIDELTRAESRVKALDAALTVARQKDAAAQTELNHANRQVASEAEDEAVAVLKASALKMEKLLCGEVKLAADELAAALAAVKDRCPGATGVASRLNDIHTVFLLYRDRACASLVPRGRVYSQVLDKEKKTFSAWVDAVAYAVTYRRQGH
jgi:hypothetical protein